ncbi:MAG: sulfatase-like hydrolase/transferase [Acidobacteria bacterium]|nr:sulfatase-like hydrolase/transferase [Acidobacteriota bacterium]
MDRRDFLKATAVQMAAGRAGAQEKERPNFLFLIADDLTFRGVRALGNPEVETPAIDRLMERGCTFTHCFHQGSWSGAVCIASRTMLNTGLTAFRARKEVEQTQLWGQTFGEAGYDTYLVGKWHLSRPALKRSFLATGAVSPGMFESGPDAYNRPSPGNTWTPWDTSRKGQWLHTSQWANAQTDEIKHSAEIWADGAIAHLQQVAAASKPFFLYVGFNSPHDPRQAPREFVERYPREKIAIPPDYLPEHPFDQGDHKIRDEMLAPFPRSKDAVRLHRQEYYAHITYMDAQIGRILDALEKSGKAGNTYVILTADHGLAVGEHGLMGKQNLYEHSVRMPYVIAGPGIPRRKRVDVMMYQHSTFATTCELAGIAVPKPVEFPSVAKWLHGGGGEPHDAMFCWYLKYQRSVRTREHKLIVYPEAGVTQLFDLTKDPWETTDLSAQPKYAATKAALLERLRRFQRELGDDFCRPV